MICRKKADLPRTCHARPCRHCIPLSCNSSDKAIAFLRASRAHPLARWFAGRSPTGHRPATHSRQSPVSPDQSPSPHFREIHLARQSPFYGPPGHIDSRDGINLCPSSTANPSRQHSRAHPLARWFAGRTPTCHRPATHSRQSPVSARLGPIKARPHTFVKFTWHPNRPSRALQGVLRFQVEPNWAHLDLCRELTI